MRTLLIDGDILVVSTGAALEVETDWGDDEWTLTCDVAEVKATVLSTIRRLERDLDADASVITLSKGTTFRHDLYAGYKKGRQRKPVGTNEVKRWLIEEHGAKYKPGIEADDVMGILATNPRIITGEKIIVSQDKDMMTIPGLIYRNGEIITVTPEEAEINFLTQALTGDTTDGYPGCPGMGPVTAATALQNVTGWESYEHTIERGKRKGEIETRWKEIPVPTLWDAVVHQYLRAGLTEEDALLQARLARILHNDDYDHAKKEPILWTPR
ncbi:exonuclease [Mesorhizobium sp. B3-1-3]|uniref:exonuclease n=1 Tax=unclassified Mesorhizobium TaxID=325217 RepID=UPI0011272038|nr:MULTISPECIES: exonuclease [unclassified Mesorhizobium]TPI67589.1 exonuclease [Mesorhizobium sp. B3-1-8]TPI75635.1 exonuclease [Mesorhizobium sp. B3-1-3]